MYFSISVEEENIFIKTTDTKQNATVMMQSMLQMCN